MKEWQSLAHVRWECKYHVVFVPKYRKKVIYGRTRKQIGRILRQLCRQKGVEIIEGHAMADHIHLVLSVPPKFSVLMVVGLADVSLFLGAGHFSKQQKTILLYGEYQYLQTMPVKNKTQTCLVNEL